MSARHRPARREPAVAPVLRLSTLRAPERGGAVEDVMARIGLAVDVGLLAPNERLPSIDEIGATFGVAPITVRRALTALCARGILLARRGRNGGTFVAPEPTRGELEQFAAYRIASTEIADLLDHRLVLECGHAYVAAGRATRQDVTRLRALAGAMDAAHTWTEFRAIDPKFHADVAAIAGGSEAVEALVTVLRRLVEYYVPYPIAYLRRSNEDHRALVDALEAGDPAGAAEIAKRHVEELYSTVFVGRIARA